MLKITFTIFFCLLASQSYAACADKHCVCVRDEIIRRSPPDQLRVLMMQQPSESRRQALIKLFSKTLSEQKDAIEQACDFLES